MHAFRRASLGGITMNDLQARRTIWVRQNYPSHVICLGQFEIVTIDLYFFQPRYILEEKLEQGKKRFPRQPIGTGINNLNILEMHQTLVDPPICRIPKFFCIQVPTFNILRNELSLQIQNIMTNDERYNWNRQISKFDEIKQQLLH